jgi:hypothetical protein
MGAERIKLEVIEGEGRTLEGEPLERLSAGELVIGPARVVETGPRSVLVEAVGVAAPVRAHLAFSQPYAPAKGDLLLVIGKSDGVYAIGVLQGTGRTTLAVEGDLDVVGSGTLRLQGRKGVAVAGEEVHVEAAKLETRAESAIEAFGTLVQRVEGLATQHARDIHVEAQESAVTHAKNATILTEENVVVNGKQLYLG